MELKSLLQSDTIQKDKGYINLEPTIVDEKIGKFQWSADGKSNTLNHHSSKISIALKIQT